MATDEELERAEQYQARKFRRIERQCQNATIYQEWHGKAYDGVSDVSVVVKRDMRSKGYQSNYEPVLSYWVLCYRDGKPFSAASKTPKALETFMEPLDYH